MHAVDEVDGMRFKDRTRGVVEGIFVATYNDDRTRQEVDEEEQEEALAPLPRDVAFERPRQYQ